jgi:phosphoribosyl 1,2-cyclic phosphodiesterase
MKQGLEAIGADFSEIHAILVTHEHIDHIKALGPIARKYGIPIYATPKTWQAIRLQGRSGEFPIRTVIEFDPDRAFLIRGIRVVPFSTSHDAAQPTGFAFDNGRRKVGIMTDTGYATSGAKEALFGAHTVILESNHDPDLLRANPRYPEQLKVRIAGRRGHLSNADSAAFLSDLVRGGTCQVALAHLSQENNTPELAYDTAAQGLLEIGAVPGQDLNLVIARQEGPVGLLGV